MRRRWAVLAIRLLVTGGKNGTVRLWEVDGGKVRGRDGFKAVGPVPALVVSPDGSTLATASADGTAALWDVAEPHRAARTAVLTGQTDGVTAVAFGPDGRTAITGGADGTAAGWDVAALQFLLAWHGFPS